MIILNPFMMNGVSLEEFANDYCQSEEAVTNPSDPVSLVCDNKFKKDKFVWVLIDGLAYDQLALWPNRSQFNLSNFFRVETNEYKQSGALHETIITGKFSRNYLASETRIDHIFKQAHRSNQTLHFVGSAFPLINLLGGFDSKLIFHSVIKWSEQFATETLCQGSRFKINDGFANGLIPALTDHSHLKPNVSLNDVYGALLGNYNYAQHEMKDRFSDCLATEHFQSQKMESLIFYTARIDHYNHSFDKKHIQSIFNVFAVETNILGLTQWVNNHPDYALIVSSDHGGQSYIGQDDICNHGCNEEGNEAILMVYTKELGMSYETLKTDMRKITHHNVAPTVAQIMKNVNIPLEALGLAYELGKDNVLRYAAVKSKEIQLIQFVRKYIMKYPHRKKALEHFIGKLTHSDYSNKVTSTKMVDQMDNQFFLDYQQFLKSTQQEISSSINKSSKTFVRSFGFFFIMCFLLAKIGSELNALRGHLTTFKLEKAHYLLIALISSALLLEVIMSFVFSQVDFGLIIVIARLFEGCLLFLASQLYFSIFSAEKSRRKIAVLTLCSIGLSAIGMIMIYFNLFPFLRYYLTPEDMRYRINVAVLYPLALGYLFYKSHSMSHLYLCAKPKLKVSYPLYALSIIIVVAMFLFDKDLKESFVFHSPYRMKLVRVVYAMIFIYLVLSFICLYETRNDLPKNNDKARPPYELNASDQHKKVKAHVLLQIPMFLFVFFISDEAERLLMLLAYYPLNDLLYHQFTREKGGNAYWKIISLCFILFLPDIFYIITMNTFSFTISLRVTIKCIGSYADATPILTGILMGTHKLKFFMITATYLLGISPLSMKNYIKGDSRLIRLIIDVQITFMICLNCVFLFSVYEQHFLQVFMWLMTKCMTSVIYDIDYFFWYFFNILCRRNKSVIIKDVNMIDLGKSIEMEEIT